VNFGIEHGARHLGSSSDHSIHAALTAHKKTWSLRNVGQQSEKRRALKCLPHGRLLRRREIFRVSLGMLSCEWQPDSSGSRTNGKGSRSHLHRQIPNGPSAALPAATSTSLDRSRAQLKVPENRNRGLAGDERTRMPIHAQRVKCDAGLSKVEMPGQ
jgi:hypothetical protein